MRTPLWTVYTGAVWVCVFFLLYFLKIIWSSKYFARYILSLFNYILSTLKLLAILLAVAGMNRYIVFHNEKEFSSTQQEQPLSTFKEKKTKSSVSHLINYEIKCAPIIYTSHNKLGKRQSTLKKAAAVATVNKKFVNMKSNYIA